MKVAIYRVLINDYDYLIEDPYIDKNYDYFNCGKYFKLCNIIQLLI